MVRVRGWRLVVVCWQVGRETGRSSALLVAEEHVKDLEEDCSRVIVRQLEDLRGGWRLESSHPPESKATRAMASHLVYAAPAVPASFALRSTVLLFAGCRVPAWDSEQYQGSQSDNSRARMIEVGRAFAWNASFRLRMSAAVGCRSDPAKAQTRSAQLTVRLRTRQDPEKTDHVCRKEVGEKKRETKGVAGREGGETDRTCAPSDRLPRRQYLSSPHSQTSTPSQLL